MAATSVKKPRVRMTKARMSSYMRNVGRSFGYAIPETLKNMNPTVTALFKSTAEQSKELYQSIKTFNPKALGFESENLGETISQGLKDLKNNALDDIRTGKWYNKERIDRVNDQMAQDMMGINFDDFGDFDDFNFDDTELDEEASIVGDATKATVEAMDKVGGKVSTAVSTAAIKSADYIVESGRLNTKALYNLNLTGFGQVNKGVAAINGNLQLLVGLAEPLSQHMQNSALFYTKSQEYYDQSLDLLKQIASNTSPKSSNGTGISTKRGKGYMDYITSDGIIDFQALLADGGKRIKENTELMTSMMSMVPGGEKAIIKMATASPLQFALTASIGQLFNYKFKGRSIRDSFEDFNKVLSNFSVGLLGRAKNARFTNRNGMDTLLSPFLRGIRDFLLPSQKITKKPNTGNYEKGKVDWDGMSRRALMDVIPKQLGQIIALLKGTTDVEVYDYERGKFVKSSTIGSARAKEKKAIINSAGGDLFKYVNKSVDKSKLSNREKKIYKQQMEKFLEYAVMNEDDTFLNFLTDGFDFSKAGIDANIGRDLQKRVRAIQKQRGGNYALSSFAGNVYTARNNISRRNENVSSLDMSLYDNSRLKRGKGGSLIEVRDENGLTTNDYLNKILEDVSYIAKNLKNLAGVPGVGGVNQDGTTIHWEEGDKITKSSNKTTTMGSSTDRIKSEHISGKSFNKTSYNVEDSVSSAMNIDDPDNYLDDDEKKYLAKKAKAEKDNKPFKRDDKIEDSISRKRELHEAGGKVSSFASNMYKKIRGNDGKSGDFIRKFEYEMAMSTDHVTEALDEMSRGLTNFVYDKDKGLFALMDTMSMGVLSMLKEMIPRPLRQMMSHGWKAFKESDFGQSTFKTLKGIGLSFFDKHIRKIETPEAPVMQEYRDQMNDLEDDYAYEDYLARSGHGSGLVGRYYNKAKFKQLAGGSFWGGISRGSYSIRANGAGYSGIARSSRARTRRFSGGKSNAPATEGADEEAASDEGDEEPPEAGNQSFSAAKEFLGSAAKHLGNKIFNSITKSLGKDEDDQNKIKETLNKLGEEAGLGKGAIGAGAFIGAGASLLTGAFLGPIAGAAIGAGVGFVSKSKTAQNFLFGEWDEKGEQTKKGVLPKELSKFFKQNAEKTGKGAGIGLIAGSFLGSPILGAVVGATAGYVSSSDKAKKFLFGDENEDGMIPKAFIEKAKKLFPSMFGGAAGSLLLLPGPLIPKLVIGATIGAVAGQNGDKIKEYFFGTKNADGEVEKEGFFGYTKRQLFDPILGSIDKLSNRIIKSIRDHLGSLGKRLRKFLVDRFKGTIAGQKIFNIADKAMQLPGKALKKAVDIAGAPFRGINNALEVSSLNRGDMFGDETGRRYTAQERIDLADQHLLTRDTDSMKIDKAIAAATASKDPKKLEELRESLEFMRDPTKLDDRTIGKNNTAIRENILSMMKGNENLNRDDMKKLQKLMSNGKVSAQDYDFLYQAGVSPEEIQKLRDLGTSQRETYQNRQAHTELSESEMADLKEKFADNPALAMLFGGKLDYRALTHGLEQIGVDLDSLNAKKEKEEVEEKEKHQEEANESIREKIPNLLDNLLNTANAIATKIGAKISGEEENRSVNQIAEDNADRQNLLHNADKGFTRAKHNQEKYHPEENDDEENKAPQHTAEQVHSLVSFFHNNDDEFSGYGSGLIKKLGLAGRGFIDDPNVEQDVLASNVGRQKIKDKSRLLEDMDSLPRLETGIDRVANILEDMKEDINGEGKDKKKSLFEKIKDALLGENGLFGGIASFFTGGTGIGGIVGKVLGKFPLKAALGAGLGLGALALAFGGKFDDLVEKIGRLPFFANKDGSSGFGNTEGSTADADTDVDKTGGSTEETTDSAGKTVKVYTDQGGSRVRVGSDNSLSTRLKKNVISGAIMGRSSVATTVIKKTIGVDLSTKGAIGGLKDLAKNGINSGLANGVFTSLHTLIAQKLPNIIKAIPFLPATLKGNADEFCQQLFSEITRPLKNLASSPKIAKLATTLSNVLVALRIGYVVGKGINAWGDAESILGITEEATTGQRVVAVLIAVINAMIPVIGDLIPDSTLVNIFMKILPLVGIDVSGLEEQRTKAAEEVQAYREATGDDSMTVEKYNQLGMEMNEDGTFTQGKARAGIITKAKMKVGGFIDNVKDKGFGGALAETKVGKAMSSMGKSIAETATTFAGKVKDSALNVIDLGKQLGTFVINGDLKGLWTSNYTASEDRENPLGGIMDSAYNMGRMVLTVPTIWSAIGHKIKDSFDNMVGNAKDDAVVLDSVNKFFKEKAEAGEVGTIMNYEPSFKSGTIVSKFFSIGTGISKVIYSAIGIFNKIIGPLQDLVKGIKGKAEEAGEWVADKAEKVKSWFNGEESGGSSGVVSQLDPRYSNYRVGGRSFAANGCGPASAVMALGGNVRDAVNIAQKYQTSGGTDAAYFGEMFNRKGMSANYYLAGGSSLIGDIASGKPTVLMGQDIYNTSKQYSPFGPNNHYVVANGFDRSGNILISDPEQRGVRRYDPSILNNVKVGVSGGSTTQQDFFNYANIDPSKLNSTNNTTNNVATTPISNGSNTTNKKTNDLGSDAARSEKLAIGTNVSTPGKQDPGGPMSQIWGYLGSKGLNEYARAGLMGCWTAESNLTPDTLEGNYAIKEDSNTVMGSTSAMDAYTERLFNMYTKGGHSINKSAYLGEDGHYYPGYGLAQWTGPRQYKLIQFAKQNGVDHRSLGGQLDYFWSEYENRGKLQKALENADSLESGTIAALDHYEMSDGWHNKPKGQEQLAKRLGHAKNIYEKMTGLPGTMPDGSSYSGMDADVGDLDDSQIPKDKVAAGKDGKLSVGGILSTIMSAFSKGFSALFNGSEEDAEGSEFGTDATDGSSILGEGGELDNMSGSDPVSYMEAIKGKVNYTFGSHDIEHGKGDCSGTVGWAVNKSTGMDIGGNTLAMYNNNTNLKSVWYENGKTTDTAPAVAKRNDILLFSRPNSSYTAGRPDRVGHVGLYMGDNKYIHIGQGKGPYESTIDNKANLIKVSRLLDENGNEYDFTKNDEVNYQGVPGVDSVQEIYDPETKSVKKSTAVSKSNKYGNNKITEAAAGSGLINYNASKAGNYILQDTSRNYYKQNSSTSGGSSGTFGTPTSYGGNLLSTVKQTMGNITRSARQSGKDMSSIPNDVASISNDTKQMNENTRRMDENIAKIANAMVTIVESMASNNSTTSSSTVPRRVADDEIMSALNELKDITDATLI